MGLYKVKAVISANVIELELSRTVNISPVVNISRVKQYVEQVDSQKKKAPQPVVIKEREEWEVEKILNKRKVRKKNKFLVWWKGLTAEGDTWESRENLENTRDLLREFKEEEYGQDDREVRWQKQIDDSKDYYRRGFPGQMENIIDNIDRGWSCHDSVILCDAVMLHSVAYLSRSLISSGLIGNI